MTLQDFIIDKTGQTNVGDTSANKGQCVGLVEAFFDTMGLPHIWGNACDMPGDADHNVFDVVSNTPTYVPPVGAAVVYPAGWEGSAVGHVALVAAGTTSSTLVVFEANDRIGGGNGAARLHAFNYNTGLTNAQVAAGWPKFIVPKVLEQAPAAPVAPAAPAAPAPVATSAEGMYAVVAAVPGYTSSSNAANRLNPASTVQPGNYHVFNQANGMVNVTSTPGTPGSWVNPADNKAPAAAPAAGPANYDGNAITIQPGWGLSNAAQAAGYPDSNSPIRWAAIAALNGSNDWQAFNASLKVGQRIAVGTYTAAPVAPAAPAPVAPAQPTAPVVNIVYTKLDQVLNLVTNKNPTHVWQLDFANDAQATAAFDMPDGAPVLAYGKAQRTDGDKPAYFMTAEDFGTADTTGAPVNNRGINTVDLSTPPVLDVSATAVPDVPAGTQAVGVTALPDLDKRFQFVPFTAPREFFTVKADAQIVELRKVTHPDGSVDYPYPDKQLVLNQPITLAGTMTVNGEQFYRTATGVKNGTYYAVPIADVQPVNGTADGLIKAAASTTGLFAGLFHRNKKS